MQPPSKSSFGILLKDVSRLMGKRFEFRARHSGLTRAQWQALAYISRNEGIHNAALAELLSVEPISLTRVLDKLVEKGLVERRSHETDRRLRLMHLTAAGRDLLSSVSGVAEDTRVEAMEGLSEEEQALLVKMLEHVKSNLSNVCQCQSQPLAE
ncbi:MarR family winged helix-turn-helix transcriptional regulator [Agrobacterium sp. ES01]|uniref:MarR family winged helix-turn-helix transcriptional regulator n=1 Tax=Agrobacterium sp. ES01 TaxID=3420714 RepID=UPI003D0F8885